MRNYRKTYTALLLGAALTVPAGQVAWAQDTSKPGQTTEQPVASLTSQFVLNGETLNYGFKRSLSFGAFDSNRRDISPILSGKLSFKENIEENVINDVYSRNQTGWYLQFKTIDKKRVVEVRQQQAVDVIGFKVQLSVTGGCIFPDSKADDICTYTPGLATDPDLFDPELHIPTAFIEDSKAGSVISKETQDALKEPGFQRGFPGSDELVGIDFDIPNSGSIASENHSDQNGITRDEKVSSRLVVTLSKVRQYLYSNSEKATLARTIRSFVLLRDDEWNRDSIITQAAAWILPELNPKLNQGNGKANPNIGNNLFFAANNLRIPDNSFTVFQSGQGHVAHPKRQIRSAAETPAGFFHSFWMGFSPVRTVVNSTRSTLQWTGERITTNGPYFNQGGAPDGIGLTDSTITIIDEITNLISQIELSQIDNVFSQSGLELTTQAALAYTNSRETTYYNLRPHYSLTGNRTDGNSVFRYYTGIILSDKRNVYVGADYTLANEAGYMFNARSEAYSNPDRDYYSFLEAKVIKTTKLKTGNSLIFGIIGRKEFDRPDTPIDDYDALTSGSMLDLIVQYATNTGYKYDIAQRFSEQGDKRQKSTMFGISYKFSDRFSVNSQFTPFSNEDAYIKARAGLSFKTSNRPDAGLFQLQWANIEYDYGKDTAGKSLRTSEKTLLASYNMTF